jgi:deoxyadenosine/deoxycytidine kinase
MNEKATYGHSGLTGSFDPIMSVEDEGFWCDGKHYHWGDIVKIKRYDSAFWALLFYTGGAPVAYIYLKDGRRIKIRGRLLEREPEASNVNFLRGTTQAYDHLMRLIAEMKTKALSDAVDRITDKSGSR